MKFQVRGRVPHAALKGVLLPTVVIVEASEIIWQERDTVMIGKLPYYDCVITQVYDVADRALSIRIERLRTHLLDTAPHLLIEYDDIIDNLDINDPDFAVMVSTSFYDVLERAGKLLDENGAPVFIR